MALTARAMASWFAALKGFLFISYAGAAQLPLRPNTLSADESSWVASHPSRLSFSEDDGIELNLMQNEEDLFVDVAPYIFPQEWYHWSHVGFPRRYAGTPVFADFNRDGSLDFFYHNHYQMFPSQDWDVGLSNGNNSIYSGKPFYESVNNRLIESTEVQGTEYTRLAIDTHGTAILDIDRDGWLDMYIATGGGMGQDHGRAKNAVVMWGEPRETQLEGVHQVFRGGRSTAEKYGLHNANSRGRFTYFADFNSDGLLDMVYSNEVRVDDDNMYGYALFNQGNRKFARHLEISEYAATMVLTDADLDGHADEFVMQRSRCLPMDDKESGTKGADPSKEHLAFCETRPEGSTVVYKYDPATGNMAQISKEFTRSNYGDRAPAMSMQTADFDGDLKADLAVLYEEKIEIFLSSERRPGSLPIGPPHEVIEWHAWWGPDRCMGRALRIADLNLDGKQELIVMCGQLGWHLLWERNKTGGWESRHGDVGALQDSEKAKVSGNLLEGACDGDSPPFYLDTYCMAIRAKQELPISSTYGMAVVDWDNDGFADITLTHDVGALMMLRNNWGRRADVKTHRFLALKLHGRISNAYGVGATIILRARNVGQSVSATQFREITSASHETDWWGSRDDRVVFGLGSDGVPESITVRWPGHGRQVQIIEDEQMLRRHLNSMTNLLRIYEPRLV